MSISRCGNHWNGNAKLYDCAVCPAEVLQVDPALNLEASTELLDATGYPGTSY